MDLYNKKKDLKAVLQRRSLLGIITCNYTCKLVNWNLLAAEVRPENKQFENLVLCGRQKTKVVITVRANNLPIFHIPEHLPCPVSFLVSIRPAFHVGFLPNRLQCKGPETGAI